LVQWFLRRRFKCEILWRTTDRWWISSDGKSSHNLWLGDAKKHEFRVKRYVSLRWRGDIISAISLPSNKQKHFMLNKFYKYPIT
jgi:hypothetical protein